MDASQLAEPFRAPAPAPDPVLAGVPLGKYHPQNYKKPVKIPEKLAPLVQATASQGRNHGHGHGHSRKKSDVKKKLQQYQRDMVHQAAMGGHVPLPGGKPISPRLLPLSSPGPVTPMELEEGVAPGYLGARSGPNHAEMVAAMIRAEEERDRLLHLGDGDERSQGVAAAGR
jgi:hypothetical protein